MPGEQVERPVLLLHGFTTSAARTWQEPGWLDLLADAGRPAIAPDLLGHGQNDKPHDPAEYQRVEADILELVEPHQKVDAIGYSAGARILLGLAVARPALFERLVFAGIGGRAVGLEPAGNGSNEVDTTWDIPSVLRSEREPANPIESRFLSMATDNENDPLALAAFASRTTPRLTMAEIQSISQPTLVIVGQHDFANPAEPLVDALGDGQLKIVKGVDHFGLPKAFDFVDQALAFIGAAPIF